MEFLKRFPLTLLTLAVGLFLLASAVMFAFDADETSGQRVVGALIAGVPALAVLGGLWLLRSRPDARMASSVAVTVGLLAVLIWWWMILPAIAALVVLWFGVVKGGLARELAPVPRAGVVA
jgi:hypothetical protein